VNQENTESKFKVGDFAKIEVTGIVYEDGTLEKSNGHIRIQRADGTKVRSVNPADIVPVTPKDIEKFQAEATVGMTPDEIIAREAEETATHEAKHGDQGDKEGGEGEEED